MKLQLFAPILLFLSCSAPKENTVMEADTLKTADSLSQPDTLKNEEKINTTEVDLSNEVYPVELTDDNLEITKDTVVNKEYLRNSHLESYKFKLPTLKRKSNYPNLTLYNDSIELTINTNRFQKDAHDITYDRELIEKIDGKYPWGIDGNEPTTEITSIQLKKNGQQVIIPDSTYSDLFEPTIDCIELEDGYLCYIEGYVTPKGEILLHMMNGDAAGAYTVFIFINPDNSLERIIGHSF